MGEEQEPILCYVSTPCAYFTTQPLEDQWGDDWNDAPYEHNAGLPYGWYPSRNKPPWKIIKVEFLATRLETPCDGVLNSWLSVEDINARKIPWLRPKEERETEVIIWAGTPLSQFKELIQQAKGMVQQIDEY